VVMALVVRAAGDPGQAIDLLDQAELLYRRGYFPEVRPIGATRAWVCIAQGRFADAAEWARERRTSRS
jgi:LuxR family maltose regulon positive regulatory protein